MLIRNKITKFAIENNAELFYRKAAGARGCRCGLF